MLLRTIGQFFYHVGKSHKGDTFSAESLKGIRSADDIKQRHSHTVCNFLTGSYGRISNSPFRLIDNAF